MDVVKTSVLDKLRQNWKQLLKNRQRSSVLHGGVEIKNIGPSGLLSKVRVQPGFVILKADNEKVNSVNDLKKVLEKAENSVKVEGIYPGYEGIYNFILNWTRLKSIFFKNKIF